MKGGCPYEGRCPDEGVDVLVKGGGGVRWWVLP